MTTTKTFSIALALCCATPALAQQHQLRTEWSKNVTEYRSQNGRRVTLVCPAGGTIGDLWGTDTYTDDSSACTAAVHAGLITAEKGGVVTIVIGPGQKSYAGSRRNGVASRSFGSMSGSFSVERGGEGRIDWSTQAVGVELAGRPLTVVCPPGGESQSVWGTDIYTDDSSICAASVHAGLITFAAGGRVTVEAAGAQTSYAASDRNGVTSREYGGTPSGFRVAAAGGTATSTATTAMVTSAATTTPTLRTVDSSSRSGSILSTTPTTSTPTTSTPTVTTTTTTKTVTNLPVAPVMVASLSRSHVIDAPQLTLTGLYMPAQTLTAPPLALTGIYMPARTLTAPPLILVGTAP